MRYFYEDRHLALPAFPCVAFRHRRRRSWAPEFLMLHGIFHYQFSLSLNFMPGDSLPYLPLGVFRVCARIGVSRPCAPHRTRAPFPLQAAASHLLESSALG